jgi:hypothetical protein
MKNLKDFKNFIKENLERETTSPRYGGYSGYGNPQERGENLKKYGYGDYEPSPETEPVVEPGKPEKEGEEENKPEPPSKPEKNPGFLPNKTPSEEDAPLAFAKKTINRFSNLYNKMDYKDKKDIDSYFKKNKN